MQVSRRYSVEFTEAFAGLSRTEQRRVRRMLWGSKARHALDIVAGWLEWALRGMPRGEWEVFAAGPIKAPRGQIVAMMDARYVVTT